MRTFCLVVLLAALASCTTIRKTGVWVCDRQRDISAGVDSIGDFFGGPGSVAAGAVNLILRAGCQAFDIVVSSPADTAEDVGLTGGDSAEPTDPSPDPDQ